MTERAAPAPAGPEVDGRVLVRRKRVLAPALHPSANRRLPPELRARRVFSAAAAMPEGLAGTEFAALLCRIDQSRFHTDSTVRPYFDGAQAFADMLAALRAARQEILLEAYIISADATGQAFCDELTAAVNRGVSVRVLADAFGSSATGRDFWSLLRRGGSRTRLFRRPRYAPRRLMPILDHRKLLVVDRATAFTGGMNIADEYRSGKADETAWRDTHVQLGGTLAWELAVLFEESWTAAGGDPMDFGTHSSRPSDKAPSLLLDLRPGRGQQEVHACFAAIIGAARERLWITNAYFAPNPELLGYLLSAARRGVEVRLLLPGRSDIPLVRTAGRGYYADLLAAGVRIYEYLPAVLHAKTLVADTYVTVIGSSNFDFRSFALNHECNVLTLGVALGRDMEDQFHRDLAQSEEITAASWHAQPRWLRMLSWLARKLAPLL